MAKGNSIQAPKAVRHALELATAVARERALEVHEKAALELIAQVGDQIPHDRIMPIYARLHHLDAEDAAALNQRLLVVLGEDLRPQEPFADTEEEADPANPVIEAPRELLSRVLRRVRGRVNPELRTWIELHTGRTEMQVLRTHAEHAVGFARSLEGSQSPSSAVELYAKRLKVRHELGEVLYLMVLELLMQPAPPAAAPQPQPRPADAPRERGSQRGPRRFKVIEEAS